MVDYSKNCGIDYISPLILSLPLINQINSPHILRHVQISRLISFFFHRLSSMMDAPPSIHTRPGGCFASLFVHYFYPNIVIFLFLPCLLFNLPSLEHFHVPVISISFSTLMIFISVPSFL